MMCVDFQGPTMEQSYSAKYFTS